MNETITITGNIATDPEHKHTAGGVSITTFRVASGQRRYDRQSGAWVDAATNWYTVSTFRSLADHAFHSLRKGDRVLLTGRLRVRDWDNGAKRGTTAEIDAEAIGHDLLWGTSRFEKDRPGTIASHGQGDAWTPPASPADEWTAPGVTEDPATEWPVATVRAAGSDARPLELAAADAPF
ncbi:single-stranded DNA-binding protein [Microbacterium deminutum]|uniref:Single-stranded DNA-binding protein n=1 Tax=Microbacterium deminutum TaxID=344164 RepID=A0ABN2R8T2_9MICO